MITSIVIYYVNIYKVVSKRLLHIYDHIQREMQRMDEKKRDDVRKSKKEY